MRVLHLELGGGPIALHPFVTVVRGCSPEARQELLDVFTALPRGRALVRGLVEAHGVLLDLTDGTLALLDLAAELDSIVRPADLPAPGESTPSSLDDAEEALTAARADLRAREAVLVAAAAARDDALAALDAARRSRAGPAPEGASPEPEAVRDFEEGWTAPLPVYEPAADTDARLAAEATFAAARDRYDEAKTIHVQAEDRATVAAARHRDAMGALQAAEDALEATAELRDPAAAAVIEAAMHRVAEAEAAVESAGSMGGAPVASSTGSIDAVREERMAIEAALLALEPTDSLPVRLALDELETGRRDVLVPSPEAIELADRWAIVELDIERANDRVSGEAVSGAAPVADEAGRWAAAEARLAAAEAELARAEAALHGTILDPDDVAELERIHEDLLEARDQTDKRFGGGKAEQRLDEAVAAEEAILDRLGYRTWADYRLGAPSASVATRDELADQVVVADRALREAQIEHDHEVAGIEAELVRAEALERRRRLRSQAVELLGEDPGDGVEGALRRLRVPVQDTGAHLRRLQAALDSAGLALDDEELDEELLVALAEGWLHEQTENERYRTDLEQQLADADARLGDLQAAARSSRDADPVVAASAGLEEARAALAVAEARVAADATATGRLDELRATFEAASIEERDSASAMVQADEEVLAAEATLRVAEEELRKADAALAALERTHQAVLVAAADRADFQARVAAAGEDLSALEQALDQAWDTVERAREAHAESGLVVGAAMAALEALRDGEPEELARNGAGNPDADALEWYLLARLAAQRSVSYAGSVPLVLDDTLGGLNPTSATTVLERLERMAATVQVVILTEDLTVASWAERAGPERALVVEG